MKLATPLLFVGLALVARPAIAQCGFVDEDYDAIPTGTTLASLQGWTSTASNPATIEDSGGDRVVRCDVPTGASFVAARRFPNAARHRFHLKLDVEMQVDGQFQLNCPLGTPPVPAVRALVFFEFFSAAPVVRSGMTPSNTLPLGVGPKTLEVFGDSSGGIEIYWDGALLDTYAWAASPQACDFARSFGFLVSNAQSGTVGSVEFDDVCLEGLDIGTPYCVANANSTGVAGELRGEGSPRLSLDNARLIARGLPTSATTLFLTSRTQDLVVMPGGSLGNLCLGGTIGRFVRPGEIRNSGAAGRAELALEWTDLPQNGASVAALAGEHWSFQAWHRDALGGSAVSNFTDGLEILVAP